MTELTAKERRWLQSAAIDGSGMYPGTYWELAPKVFKSLERRGLVAVYQPHNSAHKLRAVATQDGRRALVA